MAVVNGLDRLYSFRATQKYGKPNLYGTSWCGVTQYGDDNLMSGVYQRRHRKREVITVRMKHMHPRNPQTTRQQYWRATFSDAVDLWHSLTDEERAVYNTNAIPYAIEGYNLFIREYLRAHPLPDFDLFGVYGVGAYGLAHYGQET